jgi:simple sugar transport system permease protein
VLKVTRGVNEVVSTIMLNFIATGITAYLLSVYLRDRDVELQSETELLDRSAWLPSLNRMFSWIGYDLGPTLQGFIVVAVLTGIVFYLLIYRTRFGFDLRASGANPRAALSSGVHPKAMIMKTIVLSGAIAGLAGMGPLLSEIHKYGDTFPVFLGFTGISVALLGRNHPAGIAAAAVVWAGIEQAARGLPDVGIPQEIGRIIQGTLLLSAVIAFEVVRRYGQAAEVREAAARADDLERQGRLGVAAS